VRADEKLPAFLEFETDESNSEVANREKYVKNWNFTEKFCENLPAFRVSPSIGSSDVFGVFALIIWLRTVLAALTTFATKPSASPTITTSTQSFIWKFFPKFLSPVNA